MAALLAEALITLFPQVAPPLLPANGLLTWLRSHGTFQAAGM